MCVATFFGSVPQGLYAPNSMFGSTLPDSAGPVEAFWGTAYSPGRKEKRAMDASRFDTRHYPTFSAQEGYTAWADTYDEMK
jgi:hypothetical protein